MLKTIGILYLSCLLYRLSFELICVDLSHTSENWVNESISVEKYVQVSSFLIIQFRATSLVNLSVGISQMQNFFRLLSNVARFAVNHKIYSQEIFRRTRQFEVRSSQGVDFISSIG